ncbi:MAG TPA: metal ABC transporter permease [Calditrichaeota bacterium]|nr:metal ABC transporter permease [Calditrichota bacterium]
MDVKIWDIMAPAFFECLVLVGIHSYLGIHVIRRKVIFVDLALAQIAALGTTVGFLFGILPGSNAAYWFSLAFTVLGAAIFSVTRLRNEKIPQEAVIGLTYAIAASMAILVIDKAPHGAEHIKEIMTGSILWVKWDTIRNAAIVYTAVGIFHYIFREKFFLISNNPDHAYQKGLRVRFWDFLFYVSFGIVITHSVGTAGVLLVFVFLVVPAIASTLLTNILWKQLFIGWGLGLFVSTIGLYISYTADLPTGPTIVTFYGFMLSIIATTLYIIRAEDKRLAMLKTAAVTAVIIIVFFAFDFLGIALSKMNHVHEHAQNTLRETDNHLLHEVEQHQLLKNMSQEELSRFLLTIRSMERLQAIFTAEKEPYIRLRIASRLADLQPKAGLHLLLQMLQNCELPFLRAEIVQKMRAISKQNFGYNPEKDAAANGHALNKWQKWIEDMH